MNPPRLIDDPNYTPGNGTRYHLLLVPRQDGSALFAWANASRGGACMIVPPDTVAGCHEMDEGYLCEKMGLVAKGAQGDADALLAWLESHSVAVWRKGQ